MHQCCCVRGDETDLWKLNFTAADSIDAIDDKQKQRLPLTACMRVSGDICAGVFSAQDYFMFPLWLWSVSVSRIPGNQDLPPQAECHKHTHTHTHTHAHTRTHARTHARTHTHTHHSVGESVLKSTCIHNPFRFTNLMYFQLKQDTRSETWRMGLNWISKWQIAARRG